MIVFNVRWTVSSPAISFPGTKHVYLRNTCFSMCSVQLPEAGSRGQKNPTSKILRSTKYAGTKHTNSSREKNLVNLKPETRIAGININ